MDVSSFQIPIKNTIKYALVVIVLPLLLLDERIHDLDCPEASLMAGSFIVIP